MPNSSSVEGKLSFIKNLQVNKMHIKEECSWSPTAEATAEDLHGTCAEDRKQTNCSSRINRKVSDTSDPTRPQFKPGPEEIRGYWKGRGEGGGGVKEERKDTIDSGIREV